MRLFSLTKEIAIDLGTANTVIIHNDKIVIDEPSIVALDRRTDKLIAVGKEAQLMLGRENEQIRTVRPLRQGVIADFNAAELMIRGLIKKQVQKATGFPRHCAWLSESHRVQPVWKSVPYAIPQNMPVDETFT